MDTRGVVTLGLVVGLAGLLWLQAAWFLSRRIRRWHDGGRRRGWLQALSLAFRNGFVWAICVAAAVVIVLGSVPLGDDQGMAAGVAVLLIIGGTGMGFHGGVLALGTFLGVVFLRPEAPGARRLVAAALAGVLTTVPAVTLLWLFEALRPSLAAGLVVVGLYAYDTALAAAVYARLARRPPPAEA